MAIAKVRVLYFSSKGKMAALAEALAAKYQVKSDVIPPAYPCENERIVFILMSIGKKTPDNLRRFAMELNKSRADNVAFLIDGTRSDATDVINAVAEAGANVCDEKLYLNLGFSPSFLKIASDDLKKQVFDWADRIIASLE
ncbi:MAG: hypothetical protein ACOYID_00815 [Eubacteriales bacterium]|jgi:hypothetical protein|nr:hypothetical protein [Clostridiales bacterium]